jgi:nucleotide-binding universal stress UspA family protein
MWWYERYLEGVTGRLEGAVAHHVGDADVAAAVDRFATDLGPTVVCAATHGRSRSSAFVGSTFLSLVRRVHHPVIAVGERTGVPDPGTRELLVCVDGSAGGEAIVADAARWARALGLGLTFVTGAEPRPEPLLPGSQRARAFGPADPEPYLQTLVARPELAGLEVATKVLWHPISPFGAVLDRTARRAPTMLAVASHARTGLARLVVGSTAARIIEGSPVPVLVHPRTT